MAITTDSLSQVKSMVRKLSLSFPVASDESTTVVSDFHLLDKRSGRAETATVLIDAAGNIRWLQTGKSSSDHPDPVEILNRLEELRSKG